MNNKRGYNLPVPLLVGAIGVLILAYLHFLPLNDKCSLIPGLEECLVSYETLLSISPGLLEHKEFSRVYNIGNRELFSIESLNIQDIFEEIVVEKGWFYENAEESYFSIKEGKKEVKLFIYVEDAKGSLNVVVNGKTISRVKGEGLKEVNVPLAVLKEKNKFKLVPTIPFFIGWKNHYTISKVILKERYSKTFNRAVFKIKIEQDPNDVERALLSFDSNCYSNNNLTVKFNDEELINSKICYGFEKDIKNLLEKENEIVFESDGNYLLKNIKLSLDMKEEIYPYYYFEISKSRLKKAMPIILSLKFNESGKKEISIFINDKPISLISNKLKWKTSINNFLKEGQNSIMFVPHKSVIIDKVEIKS